MFEVIEKFEEQISDFFNCPFAVATDSCTHAIELCLRLRNIKEATTPRHTYISVPFTLQKLDIKYKWTDEQWSDYYYIGDTKIVDGAVYWRKNGYIKGTLMCISFQHKKHLKLGRGGIILCDDYDDKEELKKMSYDGRDPRTPWMEQNITTMGYHYYMTPETAQQGINDLPRAKNTTPRAWDWKDYPDLSKMDVFQ